MRRISKFALVLLVVIAIPSIAIPSTTTLSSAGQQVPSSEKPFVLQPTKVVTIKPPFGYYDAPIRVRLSKSEVDIIKRLQNLLTTWNPITTPTTNSLIWRIEPSAANSPTIALSIKALYAARTLLSVPENQATVPIIIIIGRTQEFLRTQVNSLGCQPQLALYEGAYVMGATICNRNVIVINLTGYLFVRSLSQPITLAMERKPEPPIASTNYILVDRNLSGLAHEWTHVARNRLTDGFVPDDEPAWFREGLAEIIAGLSSAKAFDGRKSYLQFHVIRLRKFSNWTKNCGISLSAFRRNNSIPSGCEYLRGAAALELLVANYGGLAKIVALYQHMRESGDFFASFKYVYNMTVSQFETRADKYASYILQAQQYRK